MRAKFAKILVAFTLICAIGGHWAILQSVAWFGMVVSYSNDSTFGEALVKTFDGKHPCCLCKAVQEGQKSERKQTLLKVETKFDRSILSVIVKISLRRREQTDRTTPGNIRLFIRRRSVTVQNQEI